MTTNRLVALHDVGQSIWLDFIDRTILANGELAGRIRNDALSGMTSNPTIFEKALAEGNAYDEQIKSAPPGLTAWDLFELVETTDVRSACDIFADTYNSTDGADGYVSIEVSPGVSNDAAASIAEARRLWATVDRPNVMVKIPGTGEGAAAVRTLIADGINVNITLLFSIEAYRRVIEAYLGGLEDRAAQGKDISRIASVASFFVSRVDGEVDKRLDAIAAKSDPSAKDQVMSLKGRAAIANAQLAYALFGEMFSGSRWEALAAKGARLQRPLWASTSTKNPAYRDVIYVEELIGPNTVNTMPPATIDAFRDHGVVERTVDKNLREAHRVIEQLASVGVDFNDVTTKLLVDGLASFQKSFDSLIAGLEQKTKTLGRPVSAGR
ncbi:MAG TPA: transaldolase [Gemmatimonadaceae bacterium]|nr:transaldolase [Gemmatimonadaceae bacterium]